MYKKHVQFEDIRPVKVMAALQYLVQKPLYVENNVNINITWIEKYLKECGQLQKSGLCSNSTTVGDVVADSSSDDCNSDNFSEIDVNERGAGNMATMLDEENIEQFQAICFAPGENQHPLSLFQDHDCEYLSCPSIYCGEQIVYKPEGQKPKKLHYSEQVKCGLHNVDCTAATNTNNLFFKTKNFKSKRQVAKVFWL